MKKVRLLEIVIHSLRGFIVSDLARYQYFVFCTEKLHALCH